MKQIIKIFFLLAVISSFSSVCAQTHNSVVRISESSSTKKDSIGTHYITTIQKDSTFADSTYQTKIIKDKITVRKGASKVTTEKTTTTLLKFKNY